MPYTDTSVRTYDKTLAELITELSDPNSDIYYSKWTKFDGQDIGEAMLKLLSAYTHTVDNYRSYLLDNLYLPTDEQDAQEQIFEMLNYKKGLQRSMLLTVNFVWDGCGPNNYVEIPKFFRLILIADGVEYPFLTLNKTAYLPNMSRLYIDLILGEPLEFNTTVSEIQEDKLLISEDDVDFESVSLDVDGTRWEKVRNIYYEIDTTNKYSVHKESDGTYIYLPSGWRNFVPSEVSEVAIKSAVVQDGFDINTENPIQICLVDSLLCVTGEDVTDQFSVFIMKTNNSAESGAVGKRRAITLDDYETEAKAFSGIVDAKAFNWGNGYALGLNTPHKVRLAVVGDNGEDVGSFIKTGLKDYIESIQLEGIDFGFVDTVTRKLNLKLFVNIGTYRGGIFESEIYQNIRTTIIDYMDVSNIEIGQKVDLHVLTSRVARSDSRIKYVEIVDFADYTPAINEIISLDSLSIEFFVESNYKYDVGILSDSADKGPFGNEPLSFTDGFINLEADIYGFDSFTFEDALGDTDRDYFGDISTFVGNIIISPQVNDSCVISDEIFVYILSSDSASGNDSSTIT